MADTKRVVVVLNDSAHSCALVFLSTEVAGKASFNFA